MKSEVDKVLRTGDTIGGVFEVVAHGVPPGVGTHANWDERLDGQLAWAVMSLQAVKAVEIGRGVTAAESLGSAVHDAIAYDKNPADGNSFTKFSREQNNAGGIEGGISNGEDVVVRGYLKPISTLRRPLGSINYEIPRACEGGLRAQLMSASFPPPVLLLKPWSPSRSPSSCWRSSAAIHSAS